MKKGNDIKLYKINGWWWLGLEQGEVLHLLWIVGKVGDCIRP